VTTVVCLSNRRGTYVHEALASLRKHVTGWNRVIVVDDTGDPAWRARLAQLEAIRVVPVSDRPAGYTAAMARIWQLAAGRLFLLEEDFVFVRGLDLAELHAVLDANPKLAQIAVQRVAWYANEKRRGSVLRAQRERVDRERAAAGQPPTSWTVHASYVEHDAGFTGNPSLIADAAFEHDWPQCDWSETAMGDQLRAAGLSSAWFGRDGDPPHVEHRGLERADTAGGY
jgi:hypothetical protein